MGKIELKPCPFCGNVAEIFLNEYYRKDDKNGWKFGVHCTKCGVTLPYKNFCVLVHLDRSGEIVFDLDERGVAAAEWNRRADNG